MFKYIDNKTEQAEEATIKTLVTEEEIVSLRREVIEAKVANKDDIANVKYDLMKEIGESKAYSIKWMFIFWIGQVAAMLAIVLLFLKK